MLCQHLSFLSPHSPTFVSRSVPRNPELPHKDSSTGTRHSSGASQAHSTLDRRHFLIPKNSVHNPLPVPRAQSTAGSWSIHHPLLPNTPPTTTLACLSPESGIPGLCLRRVGGAWVLVGVHSTAIAWCRPLPRSPPPPVPTLTPHTCLPRTISATHLLAESLTPTFALRVCHTPKKQKQFLGQTGGHEGWSFHA